MAKYGLILVVVIVLVGVVVLVLTQNNSQSNHSAGPSSDPPRPYHEWRLVDVQQNLDVMLGEKLIETDPQFAEELGRPLLYLDILTLSPDGDTLVGFARIILGDVTFNGVVAESAACVYHFSTDAIACFAQPPSSIPDSEIDVAWSPDGQKVLIFPSTIESSVDRDLWIFDVSDGSTQNLTDDGIEELTQENADERVWFDYAPFWDRSGETFYFLRTVRDDAHPDYNVALLRYEFGAEEPQQIADLADILPRFGLTDSANMSLSPDGTQLLLTAPYARDESRTDIWILDIASGEIDHYIGSMLFSSVIPDWFDPSFLSISDVQWTADGSHLVGYIGEYPGGETIAPVSNYFLFDVTTGPLHLLNDFSEWTTRDEIDPFESDELIIANVAALSSDNGTLFLWQREQDKITLVAASTAFNGKFVTISNDLSDFPRFFGQRRIIYRMASNGRVLLGNTLYTFE